MPVPKSANSAPITTSNFESPMETHFTRFGIKGLNISNAIDAIGPDQLTRMVNVTHRYDMGITARAGQTVLTNQVGTQHHSIRRLNDPTNSTFTRITGVDGALYIGDTTLTSVDTGYSGERLALVPYRPPITTDTWMYVGDTARMRKVRVDGLDLPIGLPAPASAASAALGTEHRTVIASFSSSDNTAAANWTQGTGATYDNPSVTFNTGQITDGFPDQDGGDAINFEPHPPAPSENGYYAFYGCPKSLNLNQVGGVTASDDDYIHVNINFSNTAFIQEFRIYLVCSETFSSTVLPGISGASGANGDAYVKAFSASDFSLYIQAQRNQLNAAEIARVRSLRDQQLRDSSPTVSELRKRTGAMSAAAAAALASAGVDKARTITQQSDAGSDSWQALGVLNIPLRRGDWQRIGMTTGRDWGTITGIITYIQTIGSEDLPVSDVAVRVGSFYITGGSGPDSGEATASPYDYRYTNFDPRTSVEGNPSPEMSASASIDTLRRQIDVTPASYSDSAIRQRFYRRGGTLPTDWFFVGTNSSNGGVFNDTITDTEASASSTVEIDNDQPVSTVNSAGTTILNQPICTLWGPLDDLLFGCGDPYRPGTLYFCKPGNPDSWPPDNRTDVCSPSEELMGGCLYGGQSFVFSRERLFVLYPNHSEDSVTVTSSITQCTRGMINRWALVAGIGGMYFVNADGVYRTAGGPEEWISKDIDPLFNGKTVNGISPINFNEDNAIQLEIYQNELWLLYKDICDEFQVFIYSIPFGFWREYRFGIDPAVFYTDEGSEDDVLLIGGLTTGRTYTYSGTSDAGAAIDCSFRTGAINFNQPRIEKRLGDQVLNVNTDGIAITLQNYLNFESSVNPVQTLSQAAGQATAVFDSFGTTPQRAMNISTDISWSSDTAKPSVYFLGTSIIPEPDVTINRVTHWDDLGHPDSSWVEGVTFDCDTGGAARTVIVERDYNGTISTLATLSVAANGRTKIKFSWPAASCNKVRIRPDSSTLPWILYKADWISVSEPPAISKWDTYFENAWDQYYTGLDLFCDTFGLDKTVEVYVDGTLVKTETVNTSGRLVHHITLPWGRGHVFRFIATDNNPGVLYDFRWHLDAEPSEQTNWNQNFSVEGIESDKWLKALVFQCDTFGQDKTVTVEIDGVVVETLTINANGRKVVQKAFPQHLGRVFRIYPTDNFPSRLYSVWWVFDQEPLALDRWETQEITHGIDAWSYALYAHITLKSTADVVLTVKGYNQVGTITTKTYTIPSTGGAKMKQFVPFEAMKAILHKYIFTSDEPFFLYREETTVYVRQWGTEATATVHPFGNDDIDVTRVMTKPSLAAARSGGGTG